MVLKNFLISLIFLLISSQAFANKYPFSFTCNDKKAYGFRDDAGMSPSWGDEKFNSSWSFKYSGSGDLIQIDKKKVPAFFVNDTVVVLEYSTNGQSQSMWSYAINLKSSKIVGSQVNAYNVLGAGVKARSLQLTCKRIQ